MSESSLSTWIRLCLRPKLMPVIHKYLIQEIHFCLSQFVLAFCFLQVKDLWLIHFVCAHGCISYFEIDGSAQAKDEQI